jgi:hypothetical protein
MLRTIIAVFAFLCALLFSLAALICALVIWAHRREFLKDEKILSLGTMVITAGVAVATGWLGWWLWS